MRVLLYGFWSFLFIIAVRLFYLQVNKQDVFCNLGQRNFLRVEIIYPPRGNLYDCHHFLLAANRPVFDLYWQGSGNKKLTVNQEDLLKGVAKVVNVDLLDEEHFSSIVVAEKYARRLLLCKDINFEKLCQISEQFGDCSSLVVENRFLRVYPHANFASHVLGYLSRIEKIGQTGVESALQSELQGKTGYVLNVINSTGKQLARKEYRDAKAGVDVVLTLDFELQQIAESLFDRDQSGVFILMDPENGAVRVMVSYPNFDPNLFLAPITEEEWNEKLIENHPLLNRATCALYPPASTFKLVTIAAALEEKIIHAKSEYNCCGYVEFCGRKYACMQHTGHGWLQPKQALIASCNAYLFEIAKKINIDRLAMYANRFGLGRRTNFLLPERSGLVPTNAWKIATKGERWWTGENLSVVIGQGYLLVTPLQSVRMVSSICTGYLVKPRILDSETIEKESIDFKPSTIKLLRDAMKGVTISGTGRALGLIKDIDIFAKTGTAQTCSLTKEITSKQQLEHGWVTGFFRINGDAWRAFIVLVENAGSSRPAVQIADRFLRAYRKKIVHKKDDYFSDEIST